MPQPRERTFEQELLEECQITPEEAESFGIHERKHPNAPKNPPLIDARKKRALTLLSQGLSVEETAGALGITKEAVYVWRNRDLEFKDSMDRVRKQGPARRDQYEVLHQLELEYDDYDGPLGFEEWAVQRIQGRP